MRILAYITEIEKKDEFFVITAKDVKGWYHTLFFKENKWNQIKKEYDCDDLLGLPRILENTQSGRVSGFIQTDTVNKPIYTDNGEVNVS